MMPALKRLSSGCSTQPDARARLFHFARCDFQATGPDYRPEVRSLYQVFSESDCQLLMDLHSYFVERHYQPIYQLFGVDNWEVQYQGNRRIKSSPLFRVWYSNQFRNPLRLNLRCVSSGRIIPELPDQPDFLREDFLKRLYKCGGPTCGWCKGKKGLGPAKLSMHGETRSACWNICSEIRPFNGESVRLIRQYVDLHEGLA